MNAESPSSVLGCGHGRSCPSSIADAEGWDGGQGSMVFRWNLTGLLTPTSRGSPNPIHVLLNRATPEQEAAPLSRTIPQDGTGADKELLAAG